jgi:hypothetical protein
MRLLVAIALGVLLNLWLTPARSRKLRGLVQRRMTSFGPNAQPGGIRTIA